jgi:hypothetical protein
MAVIIMIMAFIILISVRNALKTHKSDKKETDRKRDDSVFAASDPAAWQFRRNVDYREYHFFITRSFDYRYWTD